MEAEWHATIQPMCQKDSKNKSRNTWRIMKIETKWFKICGCWQHSPKREVHTNTGYLKNQQTFEVNNLT